MDRQECKRRKCVSDAGPVWETLKAEFKAQIWTGADLKNKTFAKIKR